MRSTCIRAAGVLISVSLTACAAPRVDDVPRPPNIVLIMADDIGWECFGCYGGEDYQTPNIDRLAASGVRFDHCYATPICTTSRVQIMTGQYNFRNYTHFGYLDPRQRTFAHLLKEAGYATAVAGKWQLNGLANSLEGHDDSRRPNRAGFDEFMLWQLTRSVKVEADGKGGERYWDPAIEHNGTYLTTAENEGAYGPDLFCDFVCDFIQRHRDEPFFVYYPMVLVHSPFVPTPDTAGADGPQRRARSKEHFGAMVTYMDRIVGQIEATLEKVGQAENTIVLFTGDNGTDRQITSRWRGQSVPGGKNGLTDTGTRVPLIASWKGTAPEGRVLDDLVDFTDFYATFADVVGSGEDDTALLDGVSFLPQIQGRSGQPRDWVFCHYQPYWNKQPGQFIRDQAYKLYRDGRMYHVAMDWREEVDLSDSTEVQHQAAHQRLAPVLARFPPAPRDERVGRNATDRPTYPDWPPVHRARDAR